MAAAVYTAQNNMDARNMVLSSAMNMEQMLPPQTIVAPVLGQSNIAAFRPLNVGLLKMFTVEVAVTLVTPSGTTLTRTPYGPANVLSQIQFTDLNNQARVNTSGLHLALWNSARRRNPQGAAYTTDTPLGFGSVYQPIVCPSTIAPSTTTTIKMMYEVPVCYHHDDLRGAIFMGLTAAIANLQLYLNPSLVVAAAANNVQAVYSYAGGAAPTISGATFTVFQNYLDQLPMGASGPILPLFDLQTLYQFNNTALTGLSANQDFPIQYANLRSFLSTLVVYDNTGTLNAYTDINSWKLSAANNSLIWQKDPSLLSYQTRNLLGDDMPIGSAYFESRRRPINTSQYGNMQLVINPLTVASNASQFLVGFEYFQNAVLSMTANSLPAG